MFLKHYACCSDYKLIEQLNGNLEYQFFCDIALGDQRIENYKIVSQVRCEIAEHLKIDATKKLLYNHWSNYISYADQATTDTTCYESELRYPSIQKLLWEAVDWLYHQLRKTCKAIGVRMIRSKYRKWKPRYHRFSKMRRKTKKSELA